jgi:hypothetical protein
MFCEVVFIKNLIQKRESKIERMRDKEGGRER